MAVKKTAAKPKTAAELKAEKTAAFQAAHRKNRELVHKGLVPANAPTEKRAKEKAHG